jgi:hypothetical protein
MRKPILALLLLLTPCVTASAQNPSTRVIVRTATPVGVKGDEFVLSLSGVHYVCGSATCAANGTGWVAQGAAAAALTKANDTNVTLTLGGTPATALLQATSITAGWTGTLSAARGGFGADVSGSSGVPLFAAGVATFTSTSGTGNFARVTSPTFVTPTLGAATATTLNGNTFTAGTYTLTGVAGKTLTFNKTLTFDGTDGTTMTFPSTTATIARTDAAQTFTGNQSFSGTIASYGGTATAGQGVAAVYASVAQTAQTGSIGSTNLLCGGGTCAAGLYRVSVYIQVTTAGSAGSVVETIGWTDNGGAKTAQPAASITLDAANYTQGTLVLRTAGSANLTYATTVAGATGSPQYAIYITVQRLQ